MEQLVRLLNGSDELATDAAQAMLPFALEAEGAEMVSTPWIASPSRLQNLLHPNKPAQLQNVILKLLANAAFGLLRTTEPRRLLLQCAVVFARRSLKLLFAVRSRRVCLA